MAELRRETLTAQAALVESLLVCQFTLRTGRSYSPRTLVSNFIRLPTPGCRRHVTQGRVQALLVVVTHELADAHLGLQVVVAVVLIAVGTHGAVEALHDAVGLRVPRLGLDVDQVVRLDHRRDITVNEPTQSQLACGISSARSACVSEEKASLDARLNGVEVRLFSLVQSGNPLLRPKQQATRGFAALSRRRSGHRQFLSDANSPPQADVLQG
jgi:hypothetical protein